MRPGKASADLGPRLHQKRSPWFFYGWVIVAVSFVTLFLVIGTRFSLGVFYVAILEEYQWTRAETAGAFATMLIVHAGFSCVVGVLFDRFGPRLLFPIGGLLIACGFAACSQIRSIWQLYVFLGVISALGVSMLAFVPHMALVSAWFVRRRGTATGMAYAGIGIGQCTLAPCIQAMINWFGWRGAFLSLAGAVLGVVVPLTAIFQRRRPEDVGLLPDGRLAAERSAPETLPEPAQATTTEWGLWSAIRTGRFWFLMGTVTGMGVMLNTLLVHLMAQLTEAGYDKLLGATLLGVVGGLRSLGGMSLASLSDKMSREMAYSIGGLLCASGVLCLLLLRDTSQPWLLYGFVVLYGLGHGALGPIYAAATADLFAGKSVGTILGVLEGAYGLGGALGAFLAGYAYDLTGHYRGSFGLVLLAMLLSCASLWGAAPGRQRHRGQ
jgi:MFS family permease